MLSIDSNKVSKKEVRKLVADLIRYSGCSCCRYEEKWDETQEKLGKLLDVPKYKDGSGRDFYKFCTEPIK